jgi:cyclohexanone monooxygenase
MTAFTGEAAMSRGAGQYDVVVVGAGFGGLYALHRLRQLGFSVRVYEQGSGIGGTWFWNRYPGARCDVESMQYSYSFSEDLQQEWQWTERYAPQAEILRYAHHVADRFGLWADLQLNTTVEAARFDEAANLWTVTLEGGATVTARHVVMATGCLSSARIPDFKGLATFKGKVYHTGHWPHEGVDFTGKRVAVIGTGSSAIQSIPVIAEEAKHVTVFQRTANFSIPAHNALLTDETRNWWKSNYAEHRRRAREETRTGVLGELPTKGALEDTEVDRQREYERRWQRGGTNFMMAYNDIVFNAAANDTAADFVRAKIAEIVKDPKVAAILQPRNHPIGTKRICVDTDYFATFNRANVSLVDVRATPIAEIVPEGVRAADKVHQVDAIVFATGFDAMTGSLNRIEIKGRNGATLKETWAHGPQTYLGLMSAGFPNLFTITGPGSPSVLSNMIVSIEQHVDFIAACLAYLRDNDLVAIEATETAQTKWVAHVNEVAHRTLYPRANSWYMGANIPGKPQVFMPYIGGVDAYRRICRDVADKGYEGFALTFAQQAAAAE